MGRKGDLAERRRMAAWWRRSGLAHQEAMARTDAARLILQGGRVYVMTVVQR